MVKTLLALVAACTGMAHAQTGVRYTLEALSRLDAEFCTGPCLCPSHHEVGALSGIFTLTRTQQGPLFDTYQITSARLSGTIPFGSLVLAGSGTYRIGGEVAVTHEMVLSLSENGEPPIPYTSGLVGVDPLHPFPQIGIVVESKVFGCRQNTLTLYADAVACYADCDGSGQLNIMDFSCFLNLFASADAYCNCDGSTVNPTLNVQDFACFLNRFASGCS